MSATFRVRVNHFSWSTNIGGKEVAWNSPAHSFYSHHVEDYNEPMDLELAQKLLARMEKRFPHEEFEIVEDVL